MLNRKAKYNSLNFQLLYVLVLVVTFLSKYDYNFSGFAGQLSATKKVENQNPKLKSLISKSVVFDKDETLLDIDEFEMEAEALPQDFFYFNLFKNNNKTTQKVVTNFKSQNFIGLKQPYYILFCKLKVDLV